MAAPDDANENTEGATDVEEEVKADDDVDNGEQVEGEGEEEEANHEEEGDDLEVDDDKGERSPDDGEDQE